MKLKKPNTSRKKQVEDNFIFISKVAFKLLPFIKSAPEVDFMFENIDISITWDAHEEGSEGGLDKGTPIIKYSGVDAVFNYRTTYNNYKYEESNSITKMGAPPVEGSIMVPICCLVAHELAHVVIFHSEFKNNRPFSCDHGIEWLTLYLDLRKSLLNIFEFSFKNEIICKSLVNELPNEIRKDLYFNAERETHDGDVYGLTGAMELFIEESILNKNVSNILMFNQCKKKLSTTGF